ncbi:MAG: hypothetical protein KJ749_09125 [Planctomycetes bacterium]|nr:hypothetical protein [Planctomycetota bacterium]
MRREEREAAALVKFEEYQAEQEEERRAYVVEKVLARTKQKGVDLVRDIIWVYRNLGNDRVKREYAPSLGALDLLDWVRADGANRKQFCSSLLPKALAIKAAREKEERKKEPAAASGGSE